MKTKVTRVITMLCIVLLVAVFLCNVTFASVVKRWGDNNVSLAVNLACKSKDVKPIITNASLTVCRKYHKVPYVFTGETAEFEVKVRDNNGADDVESVVIYLSDDNEISVDDLTVKLNEKEVCNGTFITFNGLYTVKADDHGLKYVIAKVIDKENLSDVKEIGKIFLNPTVGVEILNNTIDFGVGEPGEVSNATLKIKNLDPDNVGLELEVYVKSDGLTNGNYTIPPECIRCNEVALSSNFEKIATIAPNETLTLNIELIRPIPLPVGDYTGNLEIEFIAK